MRASIFVLAALLLTGTMAHPMRQRLAQVQQDCGCDGEPVSEPSGSTPSGSGPSLCDCVPADLGSQGPALGAAIIKAQKITTHSSQATDTEAIPDKRWYSEKQCNSCCCSQGQQEHSDNIARHKEFVIGGKITVDETSNANGQGDNSAHSRGSHRENCVKTCREDDNTTSGLIPSPL